MPAKRTNSHDVTPRGITWLGLVLNLVLAGGKITAGVLFGSQAILADGVHSLTDLASDIAVLIGLRYGDRPADPEHPYGHRRMHTLVAMFIGLGLLALAWEIGYRAVMTLHESPRPIVGPWPLALALITIPVKEALYQLTAAVGRRTDNPAVVANAWHHRTDALSSIAAAGGIAGAMFLGESWAILDPLAAVVIAAFLVMASAKLIWSSAGELTDRAPGEKKMSRIANLVLQTPGVRAYHAIRARKLGGKVDMDVHVMVDPNLTVREGHDIAADVRRRIRAAEPTVQQVIVHVEPDER
ncbi:MAG: cation transporter [Phycisphaerae bacterium]|nr:cation transporter [Phycisphaerae bacterium]